MSRVACDQGVIGDVVVCEHNRLWKDKDGAVSDRGCRRRQRNKRKMKKRCVHLLGLLECGNLRVRTKIPRNPIWISLKVRTNKPSVFVGSHFIYFINAT
jgi:hypothetical protein